MKVFMACIEIFEVRTANSNETSFIFTLQVFKNNPVKFAEDDP